MRRLPQILNLFLVGSILCVCAFGLAQAQTQSGRRGSGWLRGKVVHAVTGEPLPDANLEIMTTGYGTAGNKHGFFALNLTAGKYEVRVSVIGFEPAVRHVTISDGDTEFLTFRLQPKVIELPGVEVQSDRDIPKHMEVEPSAISVRRSRLIAIPTIGEPDLFRALQTLPGVSAPNDFSNELFIRGGGSDQNLILLDGAIVYNPYHLLGIAGSINPDIIEQVDLSLGGFSARYGDRLSSVVDIQTQSISPGGIEGFGNFSLLSSKLAMTGKINSKLNWVMSARRSYHDVVASLLGKSVPYYFYDLYGKLNFAPDDKNFVFISTFFSRDILRHEEQYRYQDVDDYTYYPDDSLIPVGTGYTATDKSRFTWDNLIFSAHWRHIFSPKLQFEVQASQSGNPTEFGFDEVFEAAVNASPATREGLDWVKEWREAFNSDDSFATNNRIRDRSARIDLEFKPFSGHEFSFGAGFKHVRLNYVWEDLLNGFEQDEQDDAFVFFDHAPADFDYHRRWDQYHFYFEDTWTVDDKWTFRPGLRFEKRDFSHGWNIDPRLNLQYNLSQSVTVKAAYGRFHQGLATSLEKGFIQLLPLPFPTDNGLAPESSDHFIIGFEKKSSLLKFSIESYYKKFDNLIQSVSGEPEFRQGSGKAYGVEVGLTKLGDRLNLELSYALSFAKRRFGGHTYFTSFDQRHNLSTFGRYHLGKNWMFNFRWVFATGRPFTPETIFYSQRSYNPETEEWEVFYIDSFQADFSDNRNRVRYPFYHRLDVSFVKRIQKRGWAILPYIQILNTYFRRNVFFYTDDVDYDEEKQDVVYRREVVPMMPIVPTFGVSLEF